MTKVEIYIRQACPYCVMAKKLLASKGQDWEEIDLDLEPNRTEEMMERAGGRMTVPEIFINGDLIGGYDDLAALEAAGELDLLLTS
jgi:glutaredoxin 3